jgi:acetate kinase
MEDWKTVAPAHNPPYIETIRVFQQVLPETPLVGVFETAFHRTIPEYAAVYPVKYEWYRDYGLRRLGYHGASHSYAADWVRRDAGRNEYRLISCHLGGSGSLCAVRDGLSLDNSFGFSLQTGLPHGKRVGDMDSYIIPYLQKQGIREEELYDTLINHSGLYGVSGVSDDMREIEQAAKQGCERAALAIDYFVNEAVKCFGSFYAVLGGLDHIVFTGGIGENSPYIRERILARLAAFGICIQPLKNAELRGDGCISTRDSSADVWVIPTNEELMIARNTYGLIAQM